ncbi:MAG: NAD(P)H-dependent oxidoreductase subunit E [Anaerolineae bacterium]|nr:NAD(P)H-dependent oxidoreductase subunit E [Anaerolineae bacterium]
MEIITARDRVETKELEEEIIPSLQKIQAQYGYISKESIQTMAAELRIPVSRIYGVALFYAQFRLTPPARYILRVCKGTACHVGGSPIVAHAIERKLGIRVGETTPDGLFELQQVACLGCCAQSPVLQVNDHIYGQVSVSALDDILKLYV